MAEIAPLNMFSQLMESIRLSVTEAFYEITLSSSHCAEECFAVFLMDAESCMIEEDREVGNSECPVFATIWNPYQVYHRNPPKIESCNEITCCFYMADDIWQHTLGSQSEATDIQYQFILHLAVLSHTVMVSS